jgi:hypothetical protein
MRTSSTSSRPCRRAALPALLATLALAVGAGPFTGIATASQIAIDHVQPTPPGVIGTVATAQTIRGDAGTGVSGT